MSTHGWSSELTYSGIDEVFPNQFIEKIENLFSDFGKFPFYQLYGHTKVKWYLLSQITP